MTGHEDTPEDRSARDFDSTAARAVGAFLRNPWWAVVALAFAGGRAFATSAANVEAVDRRCLAIEARTDRLDEALRTIDRKLNNLSAQQMQVICVVARSLCLTSSNAPVP